MTNQRCVAGYETRGREPPEARRGLWSGATSGTYWLEQTLRDEVREAAKTRAISISQFVARLSGAPSTKFDSTPTGDSLDPPPVHSPRTSP